MSRQYWIYKGLCDFSHLSKPRNYFITLRSVKNFTWNFNLLEGGILARYTKNQLQNSPISSINSGHKNINLKVFELETRTKFYSIASIF